MAENVFELDKKNAQLNAEARREYQQELNDLRKVLSMPEGRRFVWYLLNDLTGIHYPSFSQNSMAMAANEGARTVGLKILTRINDADITFFAKMQQEYLSDLNSKKEIKKKEVEAKKEE